MRALLALLLMAATGWTATITNWNLDAGGLPLNSPLKITPLSFPQSNNVYIYNGPTRTIPQAGGKSSFTLVSGNYEVEQQGRKFTIAVPNDTNTYNLNSLWISNLVTYNYTNPFVFYSVLNAALTNNETRAVTFTSTFEVDDNVQFDGEANFNSSLHIAEGEIVYGGHFDAIGAQNVKKYGAIGDGITDDTAAIQAALDAAKIRHGYVYFPTGHYLVDSLDLTSVEDVTLHGAGMHYSFLRGTENDYPILDMIGSSRCQVRDLCIYPASDVTPSCGVLLGRMTNDASAGWHTFERVWVSGKYTEASVYALSSEVNQFSRCAFDDDWATNPAVAFASVKDTTYHPDIASKFQTLGTGNGGNGMNQFDNCTFSVQGTNLNSTCVELDYAYGFTFNSCYFTSQYATNVITVRRSLAGLTFNSCSMEQFPQLKEYYEGTASYDGSGYITNYVALNTVLHWVPGANDTAIDYGAGWITNGCWPINTQTNVVLQGTPSAAFSGTFDYLIDGPMNFLYFADDTNEFRGIILNGCSLFALYGVDGAIVKGVDVRAPLWLGRNYPIVVNIDQLEDSRVEALQYYGWFYNQQTAPQVQVRTTGRNVSFPGFASTNVSLPSTMPNQIWGNLGPNPITTNIHVWPYPGAYVGEMTIYGGSSDNYDPHGKINFYNYAASATNTGAQIEVVRGANDYQVAQIRFNTWDTNAGAISNRMVIDCVGDGNVGIGVIAPAEKLEVNGTMLGQAFAAKTNLLDYMVEWNVTKSTLLATNANFTITGYSGLNPTNIQFSMFFITNASVSGPITVTLPNGTITEDGSKTYYVTNGTHRQFLGYFFDGGTNVTSKTFY